MHTDVAEQVLGRAALGDHLEPGVLEETRDSLAQQDRVVGEDYAHAAETSPSRAERGERRELARDVELIEALRLSESRQLVVAEILELVRRVELVACSLRDQDLAAAARLRDPRSPMDVDAEVGAFAEVGSPVCMPMRTRSSTPSGQS